MRYKQGAGFVSSLGYFRGRHRDLQACSEEHLLDVEKETRSVIYLKSEIVQLR